MTREQVGSAVVSTTCLGMLLLAVSIAMFVLGLAGRSFLPLIRWLSGFVGLVGIVTVPIWWATEILKLGDELPKDTK